MDDEQAETDSGKRISLPEPDIENITVLTKSLPNEPILPWHHYDSPWLEREETEESTDPETESNPAGTSEPTSEEVAAAADLSEVENTDVEQLALPLEGSVTEGSGSENLGSEGSVIEAQAESAAVEDMAPGAIATAPLSSALDPASLPAATVDELSPTPD